MSYLDTCAKDNVLTLNLRFMKKDWAPELTELFNTMLSVKPDVPLLEDQDEVEEEREPTTTGLGDISVQPFDVRLGIHAVEPLGRPLTVLFLPFRVIGGTRI